MVLERDPEGWVKRKDTESLRVGQKEGGALSWEVMTRGHPQAQAQQGAKGVQGTPGCHVSLEDNGSGNRRLKSRGACLLPWHRWKGRTGPLGAFLENEKSF